MSEKWRVEAWFVSGQFTGYRVIKGAGWNAEIAAGFVWNCYSDVPEVEVRRQAIELSMELNNEAVA